MVGFDLHGERAWTGAAGPAGRLRMRKPSLLIVDDEAHLTLLYEEELKEAGFAVDVAHTHAEAFALLSARDYDCLIVEPAALKPGELETLRGHFAWHRNTKLLFNTTSLRAGTELTARFGADGCIVKSSDITLLNERIRKLLASPTFMDHRTNDHRECIHA